MYVYKLCYILVLYTHIYIYIYHQIGNYIAPIKFISTSNNIAALEFRDFSIKALINAADGLSG